MQAANAKGFNTKAEMQAANAKGFNTKVEVAKGFSTKAEMQAASTKGFSTKAEMQMANAKGFDTKAEMQAANTKGFDIKAEMQAANAKGFNTKAELDSGFENKDQLIEAAGEGCSTVKEWDCLARKRGFRSSAERSKEKMELEKLLTFEDKGELLAQIFAALGVESKEQLKMLELEDVHQVKDATLIQKREVINWLKKYISGAQETSDLGSGKSPPSGGPSDAMGPKAGSAVWASATLKHKRNCVLDSDELGGKYTPISKYSQGPQPAETCRESILKCTNVLELSEDLLQECLQEVGRVTQSKLKCPHVQALLGRSALLDLAEWPMFLAAIVMYTFDACLVQPGSAREENFFFRLNEALRRRDPKVLNVCGAYLYYLMRALESLPSYGCQVLWRGVDQQGRATLLGNYRLGRKVHWSGFSSASPDRETALTFAGTGGVLLRIRLMEGGGRARDVRLLSVFEDEEEILLLPNFAATVTEGVRVVDGVDTLDLLEGSEDDPFVF